jgi:hypothetical protein
MNHSRLASLAACVTLLMACTALAARADTVAHAGLSTQGSHATFAGQRGLLADGQGNSQGVGRSTFSTAAGGQGLRVRQFEHGADGTLTASGNASASGDRGSATRNGSLSLSRSGDGNASGERSTTLTNANTGTSVEASRSFTQGSGATRSATCRNAAGQTVACDSR